MTATDADPAAHVIPSPRHSRGHAPVRRSGDPHRLGRAGTAAAVWAAAMLLAFAPPAPASAASSPSPSPTPTTPTSAEVVLAPNGDGLVQPGQGVTAWIVQRNSTAYSLASSAVTVRLSPTAQTSESALSTWLAQSTDGPGDDGTDPDWQTVTTTTLDSVASGQTATALVAVPAATTAALTPGVYRVEAVIRGPAQTRFARSAVTVTAPTATPVALATVVPITAGPLRTGLLTAAQLRTMTGPAGTLTTQLDAVTGTSAILAIDPAIPAAIRVLGTTAPSSATEWLARLLALPNERFALQFGDADVAAQADAGATALQAPTSLAPFVVDAGTAVPPPATPTTPAHPTPSPSGTPAPPSVATLSSIGPNARAGVVWPFTGTADAKTVALADASGHAAGVAPLTLVASTSVSAGTDPPAASGHAVAGHSNLLVYDAAVSERLRTASADDDPLSRGGALSEVTALLHLAPRPAGGGPLFVVVDRSSARSTIGLSPALAATTATPGMTPATLTQLTQATAEKVTVTGAAADAVRTETFRALAGDQASIDRFSVILQDPVQLTARESAEVLQVMGGGWLDDTTAWQAAVAAHQAATTTTLNAVSIAPSSAINLAGSAAPLRFGVRNDLPWPVNVTVVARPGDLRLEVQPSTEVTAQARSTTRLAVPVRARIGNGTVSLHLSLTSAGGMPIGGPQTVKINVRADWETIGLIVLGGATATFLVIGLTRTILRRRERVAS